MDFKSVLRTSWGYRPPPYVGGRGSGNAGPKGRKMPMNRSRRGPNRVGLGRDSPGRERQGLEPYCSKPKSPCHPEGSEGSIRPQHGSLATLGMTRCVDGDSSKAAGIAKVTVRHGRTRGRAQEKRPLQSVKGPLPYVTRGRVRLPAARRSVGRGGLARHATLVLVVGHRLQLVLGEAGGQHDRLAVAALLDVAPPGDQPVLAAAAWDG